MLLYGRNGWFAPVIRATGFNIVFAFPGKPGPGHASLLHKLDLLVLELWCAGPGLCRHGAGNPVCDAALCGA